MAHEFSAIFPQLNSVLSSGCFEARRGDANGENVRNE